MSKSLTLSLLLVCSLWADPAGFGFFYHYKLQEFSHMKADGYVFLGDSLTMRHDWSVFNADNMGIDGDTTDGVLGRMHLTSEAKSLVLMIGVNDILLRRPLVSIQNNYTKILNSFAKEQEVIILSLLPVVDVKQTEDINRDIRTINAWLESEVANRNLAFIDLYPRFLDAQGRGLEDTYTTDGIHLSEEGYRVWEEVLKSKLK